MNEWVNKIIAGYFLLFQLPSLCLAQGTGEYFRSGEAFLRSKNYDQAIEQFSQALALQPDLAKAYLGRAEAYDSLNMFQKAVADYDSATAYLPGRAEIFFRSGNSYYKLCMYETAVGQLNRAIDIRKKYRQAYEIKAAILTDQEKFDEALDAWTEALDLKETSSAYYQRGLVNKMMGNFEDAEQDFTDALKSDRENNDILCSLAAVEVQTEKPGMAFEHTGRILEKDPQNICAMIVRSRIYAWRDDYDAAVEEISRCMVLDPDNEELYFIRALYYRDSNQNARAVDDLSRIILLNPEHVQALYYRALSYEDAGNYQTAVNDYESIQKLSGRITIAPGMINEVNNRLFNLRRESDRPDIILTMPVPDAEGFIMLPGRTDTLTIQGEISDESGVTSLTVNGQELVFQAVNQQVIFQVKVDLAGSESLSLQASDIYNNVSRADYPLKFTETEPPGIYVIAPYASEDNQIFLDDNSTVLVLEGYIEDNSLISSIMINDMAADYMPGEVDPPFTAEINITGKNEIIITAVDAYGNTTREHYLLKRQKASLSDDNPMGRTWVVIIENSDYLNHVTLKGPKKEVAMLKTALTRYQVHNIIYKKNLTKVDMEKFFSVELRDLVRSNEVVSLIIWFAGHGIYVNETGYWLPVDALPSVEFSFYNLSALRASLYSYVTQVRHLLVISDACDPGPAFYSSGDWRSVMMSCDDKQLSQRRSSQIFTTPREQSAIDNSVFSTSFTSVLANNTDYCLPVERVVADVTKRLMYVSSRQPVFGSIGGLSDEGGTFFFVRKK